MGLTQTTVIVDVGHPSTYAAIQRACSDPGALIPRQFTDHGDEGWPQGIEYEPLHVWQARAVVAALGAVASSRDGA